MSAFLAFAGTRAHESAITIPMSGIWVADMSFAETTTLPTTGALTCGNLSLTGTVYRHNVYAGQRVARIVGGYGGWLKTLKARAYYLPGGISLSMVLGDAASEVGEKLSIASDHTVGDYFVREAAPAQRIMRQLAGLGWYVDTDGTTRVGARSSKSVTGEYLVNSYNPGLGSLTISTESYEEWLPGNTFANALVTEPQTISTVRIDCDNSGTLRHTILVEGPQTDTDRLLASVRQIIRAEFPRLGFAGVFRYAVIEASDTLATCRPVNPDLPLPAVVSVPLRSGVAGMRGTPKAGAEIALVFLDGNPSQPRMFGGYVPPTNARAVICYGDTVNVPGIGDVPLTPGTTELAELATLDTIAKAERATP